MIIDGEKWACEACVRGHRVSSCHHSDRPLSYVHKKGRPVTQCQQCRGGRKSKSTHVKCECAIKAHTKVECKTPANKREQIRGGTARRRSSEHLVEPVSDQTTVQNQCCCSHGERCTCCTSKKKDPALNRVTKAGVAKATAGETKKPRLTTAKSEGALTVFRDGHHKPAHKHNDMAHRSGAPYKIPRSHTIHAPSGLTQRIAERSPVPAPIIAPEFHPQDTITSAPQVTRRARSEDTSPSFAPNTPQHSEVGSGVELSPYPPQYAAAMSPMGGFGMQGQLPDNYFTSPEPEFPMNNTPMSAPPVDWASFGISYGPDAIPATYSQTPSYAGLDYSVGQPGLTTSSSGEVSDIEEFPPFTTTMGGQNNDFQEVPIGEMTDADQYRLSSSSFAGLPQAEMLASGNLESIGIENFLKSTDATANAFQQQQQFQASTMGMDSKPYSAPTTVPMAPANTFSQGLPMSSSGEPMWASPSMVDPNAPQPMSVQEIDQWCLDYDSRNSVMVP